MCRQFTPRPLEGDTDNFVLSSSYPIQFRQTAERLKYLTRFTGNEYYEIKAVFVRIKACRNCPVAFSVSQYFVHRRTGFFAVLHEFHLHDMLQSDLVKTLFH